MTNDIHNPLTPVNDISPKIPTPPARKKIKCEHGLGWLEECYNTAKGERALWVAVITQAMQDALSRCKKSDSRYHKYEATCWLTGNSKDFIDVCLCAGMDPDYVRYKSKRALAAPTPWRAEAGKGKRYLERKAYRLRQRLAEAPPPPTVIDGPWGHPAPQC